ncbi:MAG: DUF47 family protein [Paludibacteraceae bacterium]|nr:DUF47 family protein [Paludibacteraceae bacterium]
MDISDLYNGFFHPEKKIYPALAEMSRKVLESAQLLTDMISQDDARHRQEETYDRIKCLESECDAISLDVFDSLNASVFSPLSKQDMHALCETLDDVIDNINASAKRMMLYNPRTMGNQTMHMAEIVIECAKLIEKIFSDLSMLHRDTDKALEICNRIHELEHEGDDVYGSFVQELFDSDTEALEVIKIKEIMSSLESATDCANKVGKTLKTIIVKHK